MFGLVFSTSFIANGKEINQIVAKKVALNAFMLNTGISKSVIKIVEVIPVSKNEKVVFYIFNFEKGHIVISADDIAEPVLGYGLTSNIDFSDIPQGLAFLLNSYKDEITVARKYNTRTTKKIKNKWNYYVNLEETKALKSYSPGVYLIKTNWGQQGTYQQYCPIDPNTNVHSVVGCVGVALGQILKYWDYQVVPEGTISYTPSGFSNPLTVHFYYQYNSWNIPLLLYHSAVAVRSNFGSNSTGASPLQVQTALQTYFGFNAAFENSSSHSNNEWINMLKANIDLEQPVFYAGYNQDVTSGHGWVIDGYKTNNTFHCNWGWDGSYDDWYLLGDLTPGSHSYSNNQVAVLDICPVDCSNVNISNTTFNNNASYKGCRITVENCTVNNGAKLTLDANQITIIKKSFEVKKGSSLEIKK